MTAITLFPHQETASRFLAPRASALLADEPGLGKTVSAIHACDEVGAKRVLVICPAIAQSHWKEHFNRFGKIRRVLMDLPDRPYSPEVRVVSYDRISRMKPADLKPLVVAKWDVLILDEGHFLKTSASKRSRRIYGPKCDGVRGLVSYAERTWVLTGTPMPNHAGELWTHFRALFDCPADEDEWLEQFCHQRETRYGMQVTGSKNLPTLGRVLHNHMLRRKTDEVMDLPPLRFTVETLPWSSTNPASRTLLKDVPRELDEAWDDEHIARVRRMVGVAKIPLVVNYVQTALEENSRKMLIFAWHREVISELERLLNRFRPVVIHGGTKERDRNQAITAFQGDVDVRVFIGQIQACGTAITLTAAQDVVFAESDWTPELNFQAAKRAHRIGQTQSVLARHLVIENTFEAALHRTLVRKEAEIASLIDGKGKSNAQAYV